MTIEQEIENSRPESNIEPEIETVAPKKRGRPRKNPVLDEQSVPEGAPREKPRKKTPRPDSNKLASQIMGLHIVAARATGINELMLSDAESIMLAESIITISEEYGLSMSGKTGALIQLAGTLAIIYGPRYIAFQEKRRAENATPVN